MSAYLQPTSCCLQFSAHLQIAQYDVEIAQIDKYHADSVDRSVVQQLCPNVVIVLNQNYFGQTCFIIIITKVVCCRTIYLETVKQPNHFLFFKRKLEMHLRSLK